MSGSATSRKRSGVDLPTLAVTAVASAVAAYVTSKIWAAGTLAAAAFTPVLVALLKELLDRPAQVITRAVPVRGVVRSSSGPDDPAEHPPVGSLSRGNRPEDIEARIAQLGEAPGSSRPGQRRAWQVAVVTGLLGFLVAGVIITVPELVAGSSASGGGRDTTLFGGGKSAAKTPTTTDTTTETTPSDTETTPLDETVTVPPAAETVTVPPPAVTVPEEPAPVDPGARPTPAETVPVQPPPPG